MSEIIGLVCVVLSFFLFWMAHETLTVLINLLRMPKEVYTAYARLIRAVDAANQEKTSDEQRRILRDAEEVRLVNKTFFTSKKRGVFIGYYITRYGWKMRSQGYYPTTASIDAELKEFLLPSPTMAAQQKS